MELVTGRAGSPHITSQQDRQKHQGIWGDGAYILNTGNMLEPEVQSSNKILIKDGALMFQGALFSVKVGTTDEITINNGNQGMQRKDLVVARYTYDSSQNIESAEWVVIQGTPAASNPVAPTGTDGDIQAGDSTVDCPFMVVNLNGINVTGVDIIPEKIPTLPDLIGNINNGTKELWALHSPGWMMADGSTLTLPEPISKQKNGIILVWSRHDPDAGSSLNYGWNYSYIPKDSVTQGDSDNGHNFLLSGESLGYVASKYLYISDTQIVGSTNNAVNNVTGSGITTRNRNFALRQVLAY